MELDVDACYRAVSSRDRRFDGVFYTAVRTTGIYCRPSCPARTPALLNVIFHRSAAAAQAAGYRACKRCLPDATPGSPEWDVAATAAGRAMRLIADGVVDREGVEGLARRMGYTPRHLGRLLVAELGAGPLALARARRAQNARVLVETTSLGLAEVGFAAGFASVRQFNDTVREVYDATPSQLRGRRPRGTGSASATAGPAGTMELRLAVRTPFAGSALRSFLADHAVSGIEAVDGATYSRTLDLPHGPGVVSLELTDLTAPGTAFVPARFRLTDLRDTGAALERVRRVLDADCDPIAVAAHLALDPILAPLVAASPGLRVPGTPDGAELAVRTIVGQQVSVAGARTVLGRLVATHGLTWDSGIPGVTHLFPSAAALAELDPETLPMPRARGRALAALAGAIRDGAVVLDRGAERDAVRAALLALPGIGPWTADYVSLRALGHPDVFLPGDVGLRRALERLGADSSGSAAWRPWRSYASLYLWNSLSTVEAA
jgi:AraC family transcriptional regulator of adaptative response / DNA-3-methyladenine glycosylase II